MNKKQKKNISMAIIIIKLLKYREKNVEILLKIKILNFYKKKKMPPPPPPREYSRIILINFLFLPGMMI